MQSYDVAVVGAGPAGATAAREIATAGVRTVLIERERLPRYKSCAGGIPLRTVRLLPFSIASVVEDEVSGIAVSHCGQLQFQRQDAGPFALMVMRDRFDHLLAQEAVRAGAELRQGCALRAIDGGGRRFTLQTDHGFVHADILVGADGANSRVARATGLGRGLSVAAALEAEIAAPRAALARWRGMVNVDQGYRPAGYGWLFPKRRLLSIGLVRPRAQASRLRHDLARYLQCLGLTGAPCERLAGHKVLFRRGAEPIAGDGVLLTGDAAGMVDEFTEEGIFYAIQSGRLAAQTIQARLARPGARLDSYQAAIDRELMPELRAARTIAGLYFGLLDRAPAVTLSISRWVPYLWRAFYRVQRGDSSYDAEVRRARLVAPLGRLLVR